MEDVYLLCNRMVWMEVGCSRTLDESWAILQKRRKVTKGGKEVIEQI